MIGRLFDLAMALSFVDWRRALELLAGTLMFWSAALTLIGLLLQGLPWALELVYWLLFSL